MYVKRIYKDGAPGVVECLRVIHTGTSRAQNFSTGLVYEGIAAGFIRLEGDELILKTDEGDLRYRIKREPGWYSCHDGAAIPISQAAQREAFETGSGRLSAGEARAFLESRGLWGKPSPDPSHPAGYEVVNAYQCELDAAQHEAKKAVPGGLGTIGDPAVRDALRKGA